MKNEGESYPANAVVMISVERVPSVISPGHAYVADETEIRMEQKTLRAASEAAFEAHLEGK